MSANQFQLEGNKLIVRTSLDAGREEELRQYCDRLLARPDPELIVDLSTVDYIHSLSVGTLSYAWVEAISRDKEVCFIVSQYVSDVFARTGLGRVFNTRPAQNSTQG